MTLEIRLIFNATRSNVLCEQAVIADRTLRRMRGLLGRTSLPSGEGILLTPAPSIHTAFMRFPIDVVFTDRELRVLKLVPELAPWRTASARKARSALELASGECARRGIEVGDALEIIQGHAGDALEIASGDDSDQPQIVSGQADCDPLEMAANEIEAMRAPDREVAETRENPLFAAPLRVLLVSRDRRFRSVAATLLERRGMSVAISQPTGRLAELAIRERAEVVVLDAGRGLTDAAHQAAEIEALLPKVGVVVVGEQSASGLSSMPVLAKWGLFDGLFSAIELARPNRDGAYADVS